MSNTNDWPGGGDWSGQPSAAPDGGVVESDSFTQTETIGFGSRLAQSFTGILIGLVLVVACTAVLFWNEGRAVFTARALTEGQGMATTVSADRVDPASENRLVHVVGRATGSGLRDPDTGVAAQGLRLVRRVEMFSWTEHRDTETRSNVGGSQTRTTTYRYTRDWAQTPQESSRFNQPQGHQNPPMALGNSTVQAQGARVGAFAASDEVLSRLGEGPSLAVTDVAGANARFGGRARLDGGRIYVGNDPSQPQIGDLRISYTLLPEQTVTVIGAQRGGGFAPYRASNGEQFLLAAQGDRSAADLFQRAQDDNKLLTWIVRVVALVLMFAGFGMLFGPFVVLGDVIPIIGSILAAGAGVIAFAMTLLFGGTTIAIAWLWYRPLLGAAAIAGIIAAFYGIRVLTRGRAAPQQPQPQQPYPQQPQPYPPQGYAPPQQPYPPQAGYPDQPYQPQPAYAPPPQQQPYPNQAYGQAAFAPPQQQGGYGQPYGQPQPFAPQAQGQPFGEPPAPVPFIPPRR